MKNIRTRYASKLLLIVFSVGLSSCGWQLRGSNILGEPSFTDGEKATFVINPIYAQDQRDFKQIFNRLLSSNQIQTSSDAGITVVFDKEKINRRAQAYGSTGIPIQLLLTMTVAFEINNKLDQNKNIQRSVTSRRDYDFDAELVGPKDQEQDELLKEMQEELASQILRVVYQSQR